MLKDRVVHEVFHDGEGWVNQHYIHSLEQFYAVVTREWNMHLSRTQALIGTPAGTILFRSPK
ncbi:hypothetical protein [Polynucleobacter sp. es-MAR-4]|uniref:hypothetical protein n=1 Tax=Polynucleobacter sp. es-MAR-4 TaxID=1855655 RepID=UPI001C0CE2A4|nr:hypothetical protein [Polynucleobacter sp. es-MAR-4]MBU3637368.1 hypothetical protein [Polynucleobacter sp. es-MAR-4]